MNFNFSTSTKIIFGAGKIFELLTNIKNFDKNVLIISGNNVRLPDNVFKQFSRLDLRISEYQVREEPSIETIQKGVNKAKENEINFIISIGGGSVIDTGKAISALITNHGEIIDYLEVVGNGKPLVNPSIPFIAIPTTAGTGSEVTKNAVIAIPEKKVKVSLRSDMMYPWLAIIDPELTLDLPAEITAFTGMDAFAQVLEPFVSNKSNIMTDLYCKEGIRAASKSLIDAYQYGHIKSRMDMCWTSLLGGLSLANAGLGAAHGIAGPFGGEFNAPHGAVVARLLPEVVSMNINALLKRCSNDQYIQRYQEAVKIMLDNQKATLNDGIVWLYELRNELNIPELTKYGASKIDIPHLIQKSQNASSMKANPIKLTYEELEEIILRAL